MKHFLPRTAMIMVCIFFFYSILPLCPAAAYVSNDALLDELDSSLLQKTPKKNASNEDLLQELDAPATQSASDADLLNELDSPAKVVSAPGKKEKAKEAGIFEQIRKNAEFKFINRMMIYYMKPASPNRAKLDRQVFTDEGVLEFKTHIKKGNEVFNLAGWAMIGNQKNTYTETDYYYGVKRARASIERMRRYFEVNEAFWTHSWSKVDWTSGKKLFKMGFAPLYSPANRIMPQDLNDPMNPREYGVWQEVLQFYAGDTSLTAAVFPFFIPSKIPSPRSRWLPTMRSPAGGLLPGDFQFYNLSPFTLGVNTNQQLTNYFPPWYNSIRPLLQVKTTLRNWDLSLAASNGTAPYPVLKKGDPSKNDTPAVVQYITDTDISFGYSTTYKKFEFHGDGLFQISQHHRDDDYFSYVLGFTYTVDDLANKIKFDKIDFTIDFAGDAVMDSQHGETFLASSKDLRVCRRNLLMRSIWDYSDNLKFGFYMDMNLEDYSRMYSPGLKYKLKKDLVFKLSTEFFYGQTKSSFYGRWEKNNRLVTSLEYSF